MAGRELEPSESAAMEAPPSQPAPSQDPPTTEGETHAPAESAAQAAAPAGEESQQPMYALESLCMRCEEQGTTRLLLTKVPHFRELVVMAFDCPHCGEHNNEVQFAGALQPQGCRMALAVPAGDAEMLDRQVVKSESASIRVPELDFEIPADTQKGILSTVEGVLTRAVTELAALQDERRKADPETAGKLDAFLARLGDCAKGRVPFTLELSDPAGNSFIQSPCAPAPDPHLKVTHFDRTPEDNARLGFQSAPAGEAAPPPDPAEALEEAEPQYVPAGTRRVPHGSVGAPGAQHAIAAECTPEQAASLLGYSAPEEVMIFPAHCSACGVPSETRMYVTKIPYFKEVVIMSTACEQCGFRSSELKAGGSISDKGKRISLLVKSPRDLTRDVIKSDTAGVIIPELELELTPGTLGGRVTTVEGLVADIEVNLGKVFPFQMGDSAPVWQRGKWQELRQRLKDLSELKQEWHLILDDALSNSFIAPASEEGVEGDPQLEMEEYTRTWEQDEDLGLHDMNTGEQAPDATHGGATPGEGEQTPEEEPNAKKTGEAEAARGPGAGGKTDAASSAGHSGMESVD